MANDDATFAAVSLFHLGLWQWAALVLAIVVAVLGARILTHVGLRVLGRVT